HCQAIHTTMVLPDNPLRKTITGEGPVQLEEMFKVGNSVIPNLSAAIRVVVAANKPEDLAAIRPDMVGGAAVPRSERLGPRRLRRAHNGSGDFDQGGRSVKTKTIILSNDDAGPKEKSRRKTPVESHRYHSRHRSRSA